VLALSTLADNPVYSNLSQAQQKAALPPGIKKTSCSQNIEALLALMPDMVLLASYTSPHLVKQLTANRTAFYQAPPPHSLEAVAAAISGVALAVGESEAGRELLARFNDERAAIKALPAPPTLAKRRVVHVFSDGAVSGSNTIFDALAKEIPVINQPSQLGLTGWSKHSVETLLMMNPDVLVVASEPNETEQQTALRISQITGFGGLKILSPAAIKAGRAPVIALAERHIGSVSHHILTGLRRLKEKLIELESRDAAKK
jgi:ABC-type Fe3+-hydroxamate transport system substrate-binding protein